MGIGAGQRRRRAAPKGRRVFGGTENSNDDQREAFSLVGDREMTHAIAVRLRQKSSSISCELYCRLGFSRLHAHRQASVEDFAIER